MIAAPVSMPPKSLPAGLPETLTLKDPELFLLESTIIFDNKENSLDVGKCKLVSFKDSLTYPDKKMVSASLLDLLMNRPYENVLIQIWKEFHGQSKPLTLCARGTLFRYKGHTTFDYYHKIDFFPQTEKSKKEVKFHLGFIEAVNKNGKTGVYVPILE